MREARNSAAARAQPQLSWPRHAPSVGAPPSIHRAVDEVVCHWEPFPVAAAPSQVGPLPPQPRARASSGDLGKKTRRDRQGAGGKMLQFRIFFILTLFKLRFEN
jgi:hypothetical protein